MSDERTRVRDGREHPSVAQIVEDPLGEVRTAVMVLENSVEQDDHPDSWDDATMAIGRLCDAAETLRDVIRDERRKRDDE